MKKFLISVALAALGWMLASGAASATTVTINPNPVAFFGDSAGSNAVISNAYEFSFAGSADGFFGALSLGISGLSTAICSDDTCSGGALHSGTTVSGPFGLFSLSGGSFTGLAGGLYYLVVTGTASLFGGGYLGGLSLNVTPPVPLPPALLLFATAFLGMGATGYFRRKSLAKAGEA